MDRNINTPVTQPSAIQLMKLTSHLGAGGAARAVELKKSGGIWISSGIERIVNDCADFDLTVGTVFYAVYNKHTGEWHPLSDKFGLRWGKLKADLVGQTTVPVLADWYIFVRNSSTSGSAGSWQQQLSTVPGPTFNQPIQFKVIEHVLPNTLKLPINAVVGCDRVAKDIWAPVVSGCPVPAGPAACGLPGETNPHFLCMGGICTQVIGCGTSDCSGVGTSCATVCPSGQTDPHNECVGLSCQSVPGCGVPACFSFADCDLGACCIIISGTDTICVDTTAADCAAQGGGFNPGTPCADVPCGMLPLPPP